MTGNVDGKKNQTTLSWVFKNYVKSKKGRLNYKKEKRKEKRED